MNTPYWFSNLTYWSAQVALLVLAAGFLPRIFKIRQPRVLLIYWRALIAVSLLLPFAQPWHRPEDFATINFAPRTGEFAPIVITTSAPPVTHWHLPSAQIIAEIIGLIILAGIAARFTVLALGLVKLRQFRRASSSISNHSESSALLSEMCARVNTRGEFRLSSDVASPVTFGLTAPVILLPERFPTLAAQYQSAIACHELLHVRRRDWLHHLCEEILRAALWFHPAIAWLIARIRVSREQVVDLEVVKLTDARKPYLEALLEFTNTRALAAAIPAPPFLVERQLAERVALMLKEVRMSRTRLIASLTVIAACLALVAALAVWTFPLKASPHHQQNPPQDGIVKGVSGGVVSGVTGGVINGVLGGVIDGVTKGVSGGIAGVAPVQGVKDGVSGAHLDLTLTDPITGTIVGTLKGQMSPGHTILHLNQGGTDNTPINLTITNPVNGAVVGTVTGTIEHYEVHLTDPPTTLTDSYVGPSPSEGTPLGASLVRKLPLGSAAALQSPSGDGDANSSRFIGKFQYLPPAGTSSGKFQTIPPAVSSTGKFETVAPGVSSTSPPPMQVNDPLLDRVQTNGNQAYTAGQNGVTMPKCVYCPTPKYSDEALAAKLTGTVRLQVTVLANGHPGEVKLVTGIGGGLDENAIETVRNQWTFTPAKSSDGSAVDATVPIEVFFQIAPNKNAPNANGVSTPVCEYCPRPEYTSEGRRAHFSGTVTLQVTVLTNGRAGEIKITKGVGLGLDERAKEIVKKKWKFKPAMDSNGKPTISVIPIEITFQLY